MLEKRGRGLETRLSYLTETSTGVDSSSSLDPNVSRVASAPT